MHLIISELQNLKYCQNEIKYKLIKSNIFNDKNELTKFGQTIRKNKQNDQQITPIIENLSNFVTNQYLLNFDNQQFINKILFDVNYEQILNSANLIYSKNISSFIDENEHKKLVRQLKTEMDSVNLKNYLLALQGNKVMNLIIDVEKNEKKEEDKANFCVTIAYKKIDDEDTIISIANFTSDESLKIFTELIRMILNALIRILTTDMSEIKLNNVPLIYTNLNKITKIYILLLCDDKVWDREILKYTRIIKILLSENLTLFSIRCMLINLMDSFLIHKKYINEQIECATAFTKLFNHQPIINEDERIISTYNYDGREKIFSTNIVFNFKPDKKPKVYDKILPSIDVNDLISNFDF